MKKSMYLLLVVICLSGALFMNMAPVLAEDINAEEQLFSDDMVVSEEQVVDDTTGDELKEKHIGFSGTINSLSAYTRFDPAYAWTKIDGMGPKDIISNDIYADLFLDIRLRKGAKGFVSAEINYLPALSYPSNTQIKINEFFVDANANNKIYFRTGKQVLKWGQGYFWNPTDLINIEKKNFLDMDKVREGAFGTKITIPAGIKYNTYFFIGMNDTTELKDVSLAGKYEFLIKNTEMSFSVWVKNGKMPVYGYDITGRIFDLDYRGEISVSNGLTTPILNYDTLQADYRTGEWISRASLGFTKYFDYGEIKDRISVTGEFYYNQAGYDKNVFEGSNPAFLPAYLPDVTKGYTGYYQPYMDGKYYAAIFSTINKFIISDMTFNLNGIMNLLDQSAALSAGITYKPVMSDIGINFNITGYLGAPNTEATFSGNRWSLNLGTNITF